MLLTEELPPLGADILAVRGHTAIQGRVTETTSRRITVTLPEGRGPDDAPSFDLWVWEGWNWQVQTDRPVYELPIPTPDLSFLDIRRQA